MIRIICYTKKNCEPCKIMMRIVSNAVVDANTDISYSIRHNDSFTVEELTKLKVKMYPTTVIEKDGKEIARLEGTFPQAYVADVINKIEK